MMTNMSQRFCAPSWKRNRRRLLSTDDAQHGQAAIKAVQIANDLDLQASLQKALAYKRHGVRREALHALVLNVSPDEGKHLISVAREKVQICDLPLCA